MFDARLAAPASLTPLPRFRLGETVIVRAMETEPGEQRGAPDVNHPGAPGAAIEPDHPAMFSPINVGRISGVIIDQIRQLIHGGQLATGARLPSERDLCVQFGVSRVTVREALRVLEANGLVEIRVGARGGAFVTAPTSDRIGAGLTDLLALSALSAVEVTEARQLIDLGVVPLACARATDQDVEELFALCDAAEAVEAAGGSTLELSTEFHLRLAQATHNGAVAMLAQSFREPILMSLERAREAAPIMGRKGIEEHRALVEAVRDRDAERASHIMSAHLSRTLDRVKDANAK
jgi:GntR family transcriptional repressor for pyruvate dehydrogenase complex